MTADGREIVGSSQTRKKRSARRETRTDGLMGYDEFMLRDVETGKSGIFHIVLKFEINTTD